MRFGLALELWSKADIHDQSANERAKWFNGWVERIRNSANVGELKTNTAAAIAEAVKRKDQDAHDDFLIEKAEKMARAKPTTDTPTDKE